MVSGQRCTCKVHIVIWQLTLARIILWHLLLLCEDLDLQRGFWRACGITACKGELESPCMQGKAVMFLWSDASMLRFQNYFEIMHSGTV